MCKSILELSQNVKKVHAILNSIVDFADFCKWSDVCTWRKSFVLLCFLHNPKEILRKRKKSIK